MVNKTGIKQYQQATRDRSKSKTEGGKIIRVEAHPIPEHPRPRRVKGRVALVGDAAGYVTKCSGEGIYFAAKSGRMCAEAIVAGSQQGGLLPCISIPTRHGLSTVGKGPEGMMLLALFVSCVLKTAGLQWRQQISACT